MSGIKIIVTNRKASHNFTLGEKFEAGIALTGTEVKSLRAGKANLSDGWVDLNNGEPILKEVHISPYAQGNRFNHVEKRDRKLLLNKREITKLRRATEEKGQTVVPLKMYFKDRYIKVEIALAKGKKLHDKRDAQKSKEANRAMDRARKQR